VKKVFHDDEKVQQTLTFPLTRLSHYFIQLNNVIRELTLVLIQIYGIGGRVYGIRGGYGGFYEEKLLPPVNLTPDVVDNIHHWGGTFLGSSRGGFDREKILKFIDEYKISQLYVIGGDGTHRGAFQIHQGCMERVREGVCCMVTIVVESTYSATFVLVVPPCLFYARNRVGMWLWQESPRRLITMSIILTTRLVFRLLSKQLSWLFGSPRRRPCAIYPMVLVSSSSWDDRLVSLPLMPPWRQVTWICA
jgi:hypothetical protein